MFLITTPVANMGHKHFYQCAAAEMFSIAASLLCVKRASSVNTLRWTPHPVIVTIRDNGNNIRLLF